jgi:hypothetical protein
MSGEGEKPEHARSVVALSSANLCPVVPDLTGRHSELPDGQSGPIVHSEDGVDRIPPQNALLDHQSRAALVLLGGLKDEMDRPGKVSRLREVFGSPQQHRGMTIMTAGVHATAILRDMQEIVLFFYGQGIHVGAQRDCAVAWHGSVEGADDTRSGNAALDGYAEGLQELRDQFGCLVLLVGSLRVGMDSMPPLSHLGVEIGDPIDDRHS